MLVVAEMQNGAAFEAVSKKKLTDQMIEHYSESDRQAGSIKSIYVVKGDDYINVCQSAINKIQDIIDKGVFEWREAAAFNVECQKDLERDYWAGVL